MTDPRAALAEAFRAEDLFSIPDEVAADVYRRLAAAGYVIVNRDTLAAALADVALTDAWDEEPQPDGSIVASLNRRRMADAILAALSPDSGPDWRAAALPGTIPGTCHSHRIYDCWQCHPRIAIEAASDEEKARADSGQGKPPKDWGPGPLGQQLTEPKA